MTISINNHNEFTHQTVQLGEPSSSNQSISLESIETMQTTTREGLKCQVADLSKATYTTSISKNELKKIEELKNAFLKVKSFNKTEVGNFDEWILDKTRGLDVSTIQLITMLSQKVFGHFSKVEKNLSLLKISRRDFNRNYKYTLDKLKSLFSLLFHFNTDKDGYLHLLRTLAKNMIGFEEGQKIIRAHKTCLSLNKSLLLLENEIFRMLVANPNIQKLMDGKSINDLLFYMQFFKILRENMHWDYLSIRLNRIIGYRHQQKLPIKIQTPVEIVKKTFPFLDQITYYVNQSASRMRKVQQIVGNPSIPNIGSVQQANKKLFSLGLDKRCKKLNETMHSLTKKINSRSFGECFDDYKVISCELDVIQGSLVVLLTVEPFLVKSLPLKDHWDYNRFVSKIKGWPFESLPRINMLKKAFDLHLEQYGGAVSFILIEGMTNKAYSESISFDISTCHTVAQEMKKLIDVSLVSQLELIKNDPGNIQMSNLCPIIGNSVWEGVDNNFSNINNSVDYFLSRKKHPISSYKEYSDFILNSLLFINSAYKYCDSCITNSFTNLSSKYKESRQLGKDTAEIVKQLDELADAYDEIVTAAMAIEKVLMEGIKPQKKSKSSPSQSTVTKPVVDKVVKDPVGDPEDKTNLMMKLGITHLFALEPVEEKKSSLSSSVSNKPSSKEKCTKSDVTITNKLDSWEEKFSESVGTRSWDRHIKLRKLVRLMKKDGWKFLDKKRGKGSHIMAKTPDGRIVTIPKSGGNGKFLKAGTFQSIIGRGRQNRK